MTGIMMNLMNNKPVTTVSPVLTGLQVYYDPANYSGGSTITDLSGNGRDGTLWNSPTDAGNWFTLTGTQYVQTPNLMSAWSGWQHSIEVWIKPSIACAGWVDNDRPDVTQGYRATGLEIYSAGPFYLANTMLWNGAVTRCGGGTVSLNNWYQIVRTYNGSNSSTAYVNGVAASPTSISWVTPSAGWYITFGASCVTYFATGSAFQGSLGIIRVYNKQLSGSEVLQNYNSAKSKYGL